MKYLLKKGKITELLSESGSGGLTGEIHLIEHKGGKYVLRKTKNLEKAKNYESISKRLEKYGFLPKFLGRYGKNVFYEYIEGRDLRKNESSKIFYQLGKIGAIINKIKTYEKPKKSFNKELKELVSGKYIFSKKILKRRRKSKIREKPKAVLTKNEANKIIKLRTILEKKKKPKISLDMADYVPSNFRLRNGRIYLVDIESIKPNFKGLGMAKYLLYWGKTSMRKNKFLEGYHSISSTKFFNETYLDLCYLTFIVHALWFKAQVIRNNNQEKKKLNYLFKKYL